MKTYNENSMFAYTYGNPHQTNIRYISNDNLLLQEMAMDDYFESMYEHWFVDSYSNIHIPWIDPKMYWDCYGNQSELYNVIDISDIYLKEG